MARARRAQVVVRAALAVVACGLELVAATSGLSRGNGPLGGEVIPPGSEIVIELVDWSDKLAGPYRGQRCIAVNELWPTGLAGDLHEGSLRCGDDVFRASAIQVKVTKKGKSLDDGRFNGAGIQAGAEVEVLSVRDAVWPALAPGAHCRIAGGPARRVGPGHVRALLSCDDGQVHDARAVAVKLAEADQAREIASGSAELACAEGKWKDCARASDRHLDADDGPWLEKACELEDAHACRDLSRWLAAYKRETRRELELQERACALGSRLACYERARARNQDGEMSGWCDEGFAPACRFLQLLNAPKKKDAERWRARACEADPACGVY